MGIENPVHLLFIGIVALLVLGPKRLPELARAVGHGIREFREAIGQQGEPRIELPVTPEPLAHEQPVEHRPSELRSDSPVVDPSQPLRSGDAPDRRPL